MHDGLVGLSWHLGQAACMPLWFTSLPRCRLESNPKFRGTLMGEDVDQCSILIRVLSIVLVIFNMHCNLDIPLSTFHILLCSICTSTLIQLMDVSLSGNFVVCETWKSIRAG